MISGIASATRPHELVAAAAEIDGRFSMADIAKALDEELSVIVSRFANLGRSMKRTRERIPGAPSFFEEEEKTADGWTFTMPQSIRDAIRQKAQEREDPRSGSSSA
jgi:hypothetical protein